MKQRCYSESHNRFKNYGGRGIKMCDRWHDFQCFYDDVVESYNAHCKEHGERNTTIDRIDSNGDYCEENCRWSTPCNQSINRTNNRLITYKNETKPMAQWARERGFGKNLIQNRLKNGWSIEDAIEKPIGTILNYRKHLTEDHKQKIKQSMLKHFSSPK